MQTKDYTFETLTPMLLGGAKKEAELREQSLKGLLRYWWRAMHGNLSPDKLYEQETQIFGGGGEHAKKSSIVMKIIKNNLTTVKDHLPVHNKELEPEEINILNYLCYGTYKWDREKRKNILTREYFTPSQTFILKITYLDESIISEVEEALKLFLFLEELVQGQEMDLVLF